MAHWMRLQSVDVQGERVALDFETDDGETRRFHFTVTNHVRAGRSIRTYKPDPSEAFGRSYLGLPLNGWPADLTFASLVN